MGLKIVQLDMFRNEARQQEYDEAIEFNKNVVKSLRGLFARYNELESTFIRQQKRLERLETEVYKNG